METATQQEPEAGCLSNKVRQRSMGSWPEADDLEKELERVMEEALSGSSFGEGSKGIQRS